MSITLALLVAALVWGYKMTPTAVPCAALEYNIEDGAERMYLSEGELNQLLRAEKVYPVGQPLDAGSLYRIERTVKSHPMVRTAECYTTPRNEVRVRLTQRVPLLRVQRPDESFFIDTDRRAMQVRPSVRDSVLLVTGAVGMQMATRQLADFAEWLQTDSYWHNRIHHVFVQSPQMVVLCLKGNQPRVKMGPMRDYERKLAKLRVFLENGAEAIQDKHYTELDIRFRGQVIGRGNEPQQ